MFTGLIKYLFRYDLVGNRLYLAATPEFIKNVSLGDSIAVNGVCLTVTKITDDNTLVFDLLDETLRVTNLKSQNLPANVELSLKHGDRMGGHVLSGHVETTAPIKINKKGLLVYLGKDHIKKVQYKGSIAINGVSLTVGKVLEDHIEIYLIPETITRTNLGQLSDGTPVNVEFDCVTKGEELQKDDEYFMNEAVKEGEKGRHNAPPNPWVGCVIVKDGNIIGRGYHERFGSPHAEVNAINNAIEDVKGADLYVTLEPCCHYGKTPPCTNLIIEKGISRVFIGICDPDSNVSGKGCDILKDKGIEVILMDYEKAKYSLRHYLHQRGHKRPYITAKIALSMDGCYRNAEGISKWITNEHSRKEGHILRAESQTIIVGGRTVEHDDPELTVRYGLDFQLDRQPKVVVYGVTNQSKKLFSSGRAESVSKEGLLDYIDESKDISWLAEGGAGLHRYLFENEMVDELVVFRSPKVFGKNAYKWDCVPPNVSLSLMSSKIHDGDTHSVYKVSYGRDVEGDKPVFSKVEDAIKSFSEGKFVIVMDDENRENEGDLIISAAKMTESQMTEMINRTTGIICVPLENERAQQLNIPIMCPENTDTHKTAFTVSVDHISTTTGVSAADRLATVKALTNESTNPSDLKRPGHIFPLIGNSKGLDGRRGHTEAAIALCKLSGIYPRVPVIGEMQGSNGKMCRLQECYNYAKSHNIPIITVEKLAKEMENFQDPPFLAKCQLKTKIGEQSWTIECYGNPLSPHKVFVYPSPLRTDPNEEIPLRIHSECFTGDVFHSQHCDCGEQLEASMRYIVKYGKGIIIFPSNHEGRGIGFVNKVKAYKYQNIGMNTFEANEKLHHLEDPRTYDEIKLILDSLNINKVKLLTNNPKKIEALGDLVVSAEPIKIESNVHNAKYLADKASFFKKIPDIKVKPNGKKNTVAIVYSNWHLDHINRIKDILKTHLENLGVNVCEYDVPGSNELPFKAMKIGENAEIDSIICVGILIKGDTLHFENISSAVSNGIMTAQLGIKKPIVNCVLSCLNFDQVEERITGEKNTLDYIAKTAVEMI